TRDRMYLDTMAQIYSNVSKVLVDSRSGSNLLYLPLDKLVQQAAATAVPSSAPTNPTVPDAAPTSPTSGDIRAREGGRTRDREGR
ncbi:MAG: protease modulator HflK, partial [Rubrivivax sp.]